MLCPGERSASFDAGTLLAAWAANERRILGSVEVLDCRLAKFDALNLDDLAELNERLLDRVNPPRAEGRRTLQESSLRLAPVGDLNVPRVSTGQADSHVWRASHGQKRSSEAPDMRRTPALRRDQRGRESGLVVRAVYDASGEGSAAVVGDRCSISSAFASCHTTSPVASSCHRQRSGVREVQLRRSAAVRGDGPLPRHQRDVDIGR